MNDLQINYFMAVATNLSFTKTSEELFVSQPAISKQISQLEKELGAKLFTRNNKKTQLTEVGRLYYDLFSKYKADFISTKIEADRILEKKKGIIRVGFLEGWDLSGIIPNVMKEFKERYPDSEIIINCCGIKSLSTLLLTNGLDIAVTMKNSLNAFAEIKTTDVAKITKLLIYSIDKEIAGKDTAALTLKDFSKEKFIAPWSIVDNIVIEAISSYTRPYGFVPEITFVRNHESMITCVRNNMGVAIVDEWVWAKDADDLKWITIDAADTVSVARPRTKESEQIIAMEEILKKVIKDNNE